MNRSKILGASALASLMAAGAAQAEMSVSGYVLGAFADSDGGGLSNYNTSETVTVSYSDSLDNGMGVAVGSSAFSGSILAKDHIAQDGVERFRIDINGHILVPDDKQVQLGGSQDLKIYHNSSNNNSYITESGSADL